jgi:oligoendopeptidase F
MASIMSWLRGTTPTDYPMRALAETASTFTEMLVFDRLLSQLESPKDRLALLCDKLENSFATVYRQIDVPLRAACTSPAS